jgi:hypothetical protein
MRAFIGIALALLLAVAGPSSAQMSLTGAGGVKAVAAAGGYTGPADVVATPVHFWGLRAVSGAYAAGNGKLLNITRAIDSHACDILASASTGGFGLTGNCGTGGDNGQTAASFCNATTCALASLYDQISTNNLSTVTAVSLNLSCIGSLPCLVFNGTSSFAADGAIAQAQPFSISSVSERTGAVTSFGTVFESSANDFGSVYSTSANTLGCFAGTLLNGTATDSVFHAQQCVLSGASSVNYIDGTANSGNAGVGALAGTNQIGRGLNNLTGNINEVGMWASAFTTPQQSSMNSNQHAFWGF